MKMKLQCKFCAERFEWRGEEFPDECPICHAYIGIDGNAEVAAPFISLKGAKEPDRLYRAMESGAEHRMNMAAELTGQPKSDFVSMKHTNMRDHVRPGDTTFSPPASGIKGNFGGGVDPAALAGVKQGPLPNAGARQIGVMNNLHRTYGEAMVAAGREN